MEDNISKSKAEKFYEEVIGSGVEKSTENAQVIEELRKLNEQVGQSNVYLKQLTWFLVYLPIILGLIYIVYWATQVAA